MRKRSYLMSGMLRSMVIGLAAWGAVMSAQAQSVIEAISGSVQGGTEVVRIDLSEPPSAVLMATADS